MLETIKEYAILFDLDGVLTDTENLKFKAYQLAFKELFDVQIQDTPQRIGLARDKAIQLFMDKYDLQNSPNAKIETVKTKIANSYAQLLRTELQPIEGAQNFVERISEKYILAVGTGSDRESYILTKNRIHWFDVFKESVTADDVTHKKPHPETWLTCAQQLNLPINKCIVIEDAVPGIQAAQKAGARAIGITTTTGRDSLCNAGADVIVDTFEQITDDILEQLFDCS